jgi:hypothetical protein
MPEIERDMFLFPPEDMIWEEAPHISPSGINAFCGCRRNAWFHYIVSIMLKSGKASLEQGNIWHKGLEGLYTKKTRKAGVLAISRAIKKSVASGFSAFKTPTDIAIQHATLKGMFKGYYKAFGKKDLRKWEIVGVEVPYCERNWLGSGIDFVGIIDLIIYIKSGPSKGFWVVEHKSTTNLKYHTAEVVKHKVQTMAYVYAGRKFLGHKIRGIIWNATAKPGKRLKKNQTVQEYCKELEEDYPARPDFYFARHQMLIPKKRIEEWEEDMFMIMHDVALCHEYPGDKTLWYKSREQCDSYGGCDFAPLCYRGIKRSTTMLYRKIERS